MADNGTWGEYSKLVLQELERLNDGHAKMRSDMDTRFTELNTKISETKNIDAKCDTNIKWIEKVNDVWSPSQMKEAKDEIYAQKNRWAGAIAIITFVQIAIGIVIAVWGKLH